MFETANIPASKNVSDSQVELHQFMMLEHANMQGTVHGGFVMKLVDETGALCAIRHAQRPVVTRAIDSMTFHSPVYVGNVMHMKAHLNYVGKSSMEVEVHVMAENPLTGERTYTNSAFVVYVALDSRGKPATVPRLDLESDEERRRWTEGEHRQERRLQENRKRTRQ